MASIVDLIRPTAAFDPETIAVLSAALEQAWDTLLQSGSECTRPAYARAMREVVARRIIEMAQRASGIKKSLPTARFVFWLRTIDLSTNADKVLRERLSRRRRFPRLRLAEKACRPPNGFVYWKCRTAERISAAPYGFGMNRLS
jgi:hypothetical protein